MKNSNVTPQKRRVDSNLLKDLKKFFTPKEMSLLSLPVGKELQFINEAGIFPA